MPSIFFWKIKGPLVKKESLCAGFFAGLFFGQEKTVRICQILRNSLFLLVCFAAAGSSGNDCHPSFSQQQEELLNLAVRVEALMANRALGGSVLAERVVNLNNLLEGALDREDFPPSFKDLEEFRQELAGLEEDLWQSPVPANGAKGLNGSTGYVPPADLTGAEQILQHHSANGMPISPLSWDQLVADPFLIKPNVNYTLPTYSGDTFFVVFSDKVIDILQGRKRKASLISNNVSFMLRTMQKGFIRRSATGASGIKIFSGEYTSFKNKRHTVFLVKMKGKTLGHVRLGGFFQANVLYFVHHHAVQLRGGGHRKGVNLVVGPIIQTAAKFAEGTPFHSL